MRATANEVPYGYMDASGAAKGIGPDVAAAIFKKLGIEVDWTVTPFGSLIPGLKAKRFEFVAAEQNVLPDRCKQVQFTVANSSAVKVSWFQKAIQKTFIPMMTSRKIRL